MSPERQEMKNKTYGQIALMISNLATCKRAKVGAVLLRKDGSVAGMGYNGAPPGMRHCTDDTCNASTRCVHTAHAEENAIRHSLGDFDGATLYVTGKPCKRCMLRIVGVGIKQVVYFPYKPLDTQSTLAQDDGVTDAIAEAGGVKLLRFKGNLNWMRDRMKVMEKLGIFDI